MYCKRLLGKLGIFLFILLFFSPVVFSKSIAEPTRICDLFKDDQLAIIMARVLHKFSKEDIVVQSELDRVYLLDANRYSEKNNAIQTLAGVEYLNNLEYLSVGGNDITDLSPLQELTGIHELCLISNRRLKDIRPLSRLRNMQKLILTNTSVEDISVLLNMKELYFVSLQGTEVKDFSVLARLPMINNSDVVSFIPKKKRCAIM